MPGSAQDAELPPPGFTASSLPLSSQKDNNASDTAEGREGRSERGRRRSRSRGTSVSSYTSGSTARTSDSTRSKCARLENGVKDILDSGGDELDPVLMAKARIDQKRVKARKRHGATCRRCPL